MREYEVYYDEPRIKALATSPEPKERLEAAYLFQMDAAVHSKEIVRLLKVLLSDPIPLVQYEAIYGVLFQARPLLLSGESLAPLIRRLKEMSSSEKRILNEQPIWPNEKSTTGIPIKVSLTAYLAMQDLLNIERKKSSVRTLDGKSWRLALKFLRRGMQYDYYYAITLLPYPRSAMERDKWLRFILK